MSDLTEFDGYVAEGACLVDRAEKTISNLHKNAGCADHLRVASAALEAMKYLQRLLESHRLHSAGEPSPASFHLATEKVRWRSLRGRRRSGGAAYT